AVPADRERIAEERGGRGGARAMVRARERGRRLATVFFAGGNYARDALRGADAANDAQPGGETLSPHEHQSGVKGPRWARAARTPRRARRARASARSPYSGPTCPDQTPASGSRRLPPERSPCRRRRA